MTTRCTFECATLADAVQKASRIAPAKGAAYDKAAGILMEVYPERQTVVVRSTNLDVTYRQVVSVSDAKGDDAVWRLPSTLLAGLASNLPLGAGSTATFIDTGSDGSIRIKAGSLTAKLAMYEGDFPNFSEFSTQRLVEANDFAAKVSQVAWACEKQGGGVFAGVHVDGESLIGCDRAVAAIVPCKVNIERPVTVPLWTLSPVLKQGTDVRIGAEGQRLLIQLDAETQATASIYDAPYPDVKMLRRTNFTGQVNIPRVAFVESVNRMLVVARSERQPTMKVTFNPGLVKTMTMDLEVESTGRIQDTLDVTGDFDQPFEIYFTPGRMVPAIDSSRADSVLLEFGHPEVAKGPLSPVRITDEAGYEVLLTPRRA